MAGSFVIRFIFQAASSRRIRPSTQPPAQQLRPWHPWDLTRSWDRCGSASQLVPLRSRRYGNPPEPADSATIASWPPLMPKREEVPGQICVAQMTHLQNGMPSCRCRGCGREEEDSHLSFWCGREIWLGGVAFPPHSHRQVAGSHGHAVLALVKEAGDFESGAQGHPVHGVGCGRPVRLPCHVAGGSPSHRDRSDEAFLSAQPCSRHRNYPSAHLARIVRIAAHAFPLHAGHPCAAHEAAVLKRDMVGGFSLAGHRLPWSSQ